MKLLCGHSIMAQQVIRYRSTRNSVLIMVDQNMIGNCQILDFLVRHTCQHISVCLFVGNSDKKAILSIAIS